MTKKTIVYFSHQKSTFFQSSNFFKKKKRLNFQDFSFVFLKNSSNPHPA